MSPEATSLYPPPVLRVALGLGDQELEQRLRPAFDAADDVVVVAQCLAAEQLLQVVESRQADATTPPLILADAEPPPNAAPGVLAVAGGAGSPGRTTVAINLAAALGAAAPTVLVEADLCAPAVAAFLDRDPSRNVCTLAHAVREDARTWASALADELQPLSSHSPMAVVLCGLPKREMRTSIAPAFLERLLAELARLYRYVVVDVGPEWLGSDAAAANHRAMLASAQQILLVSGSDLVGLWHTRTALDQLERHLGVERQQVQLVLNRHDDRFHHGRSEVAWHLGAPVAAVIPFDHAAAQRAISQQRPLVVESKSRASRAVVGLAESVHAARLRLPVEPGVQANSVAWWRRLRPGRGPGGGDRAVSGSGQLSVALARGRRGQAW
ncbi:MAG: hypothetical protein LC797_02235 [Chloroflexi bacterium]|nr:hypothetical protein [Chloroflexota bacterium]